MNKSKIMLSKKEIVDPVEENILTKGALMALMEMLEENLREYRLIANESLRRNSHMNNNVMKKRKDISQKVIDSLLVDFVNYIGKYQGLDYGLYTKYLKK